VPVCSGADWTEIRSARLSLGRRGGANRINCGSLSAYSLITHGRINAGLGSGSVVPMSAGASTRSCHGRGDVAGARAPLPESTSASGGSGCLRSSSDENWRSTDHSVIRPDPAATEIREGAGGDLFVRLRTVTRADRGDVSGVSHSLRAVSASAAPSVAADGPGAETFDERHPQAVGEANGPRPADSWC
jgi:hypothetical protein